MGEVDLRAVCEWPIAMEHRDRDGGGSGSDDPLRNRKGTKYYLRVNGRKKIGLYPIEDRLGRYFTAELPGDYGGLIPLIYQGKIKVVAVTRIERVTRGL